jgi:DNA-directed RNA polymerase specialized sigma24 family protein
VAVEGWHLEALASPGLPEQARVELRLDLIPILRRLNERERVILRLRSLGLSCAEAAEHLGCSPSSVPKLTGRAQAEARRIAHRLSDGTL